MVRFISHLFHLDYEECKGCLSLRESVELLKQQLELSNTEKEELLRTILDIVKPKTYEAPAVELEQVKPKFASFSRRRAMLEQSDRIKAQAMKSNLAAKPDEMSESIRKLEEELGVSEDAS